jgi:hypothetical protein
MPSVVVRVLEAMSGAQQFWAVGDLYECDPVSAARLVAAGRAEYIRAPEAAPESAMRSGASERAIRPRPRTKG